MEYLNHFDQILPMFKLTIIIGRSFSCFFWGWGRGLHKTAEKIEVKMEQLEKIVHGKILYINKNR